MATGEFAKRGRALEDAFFHHVDEQLTEQMRQRNAAAETKQALAAACPWASAETLSAVQDAEITAESLASLTLIPLVHVAWADGRVELNERNAILKAAHDNKLPEDSDGYRLLDSWLINEPPASLFAAWKEYIAALEAELSGNARANLKQHVLEATHAVAKAAGGILGIHAISEKESQALSEIEAAFDV